MRRIYLLFSCLFYFIFHGVYTYSQNSPYIFTHLKEKDGLSYNFVNNFLKDSRGMLWVATYNGLNRFDGSHFYNFKKTKDSTSLPDNVIHDLCEDKQGNIWGATENGIFRYSIKTNSFKNYSTPNSKAARAVQNILCDKQGTIWATGVWTVLKFNPSQNVFEEIGPLTNQKDSLYYYSVRKNGMDEDSLGDGLWLATRIGIHFYNIKENKFISYKNQPGNELFAERSVAALTLSPSGNFWFYDNHKKQIVGFDPAAKKIIHQIDVSKEMPTAFGATLFEDGNNRLWFSSWLQGMLVIEYLNGVKITKLEHTESNPLSIAGNTFWGAYEDEDGTVWLGTAGGISKCNSSKIIYKVHRLSSFISEMKLERQVVALAENRDDKTWWIGTNSPVLIHYYPATGKYQLFNLNNAIPGANQLFPGSIASFRFIKGSVVVCTRNGSWLLESENVIKPFNPMPKPYRSFLITDLVFENDVYHFTDGREILQWNSKTGKVISIKYGAEKLEVGHKPVTTHLTHRQYNKIWMAAGEWWIASLNETNKLEMVNLIKDEEKEQNGYISSLDIDKDGNVWAVNTGVGLYRYMPSRKTVKYWDETDGLIADNIFKAIADNYGQIWCVSYNKFSVFTPEVESFYNFSLPLSENNPGYISSSALLSNGNIITNINNDIIEFYPERLTYKPDIKKPLISVVNIAGRDKLLINENKLHLEPEENSVTIKFGLLTDREIFPYSLEYMLDGFDKKWITAGPSGEAVYNNLPAGSYTFRLIAKAKNSSWQSEESLLQIRIRAPFYKTAWFFILLAVAVSSILFGLYRFRIGKQKQVHELQSKAQLLEKEKALVLYEGLKQQLNPHFLFNSLTSLNSLIGADPKVASIFLDDLSKTYRYILKSRDNETVSLGDEIKFAQNYIRLQQTRFEKGFEVNINIGKEHYHLKIVPVTLQNLIENAIKHNIIDEENPLVVKISVEDDYLLVQNNLQRKTFVETSNKQGLTNLQSLYHYLNNRPVEIKEGDNLFTVKIPLL
ncbi:MAG TPA: two-component regulator propeller domain-containing protein [Chitinophagaceae bacterium]|nr:two-component regulator propeller domain-containing protein [Chitinophagaceae bacterium]